MRKALDLFCGAGGATKGLQMAGYAVHGIDIERQPHYCGEQFTQTDALSYGTYEWFQQFSFVWASPPCQRYSMGAAKWGTQHNHPDLIAPIRERLLKMRVPFVIENIVPARRHLMNPIMLCGTSFGLGVFRHRLFEMHVGMDLRQCPYCLFLFNPTLGRYGCPNCEGDGTVRHTHPGKIGDGRYVTVTGHSGGSSKRDGWKNGNTKAAQVAMGIDWMTWAEMSEAIPPAYSHFIATHHRPI